MGKFLPPEIMAMIVGILYPESETKPDRKPEYLPDNCPSSKGQNFRWRSWT